MKRVKPENTVEITFEKEHEVVEHFNNMSIEEWLELPVELKFPAPRHIYQMKIDKGLTWIDFEENFK